MAFNLVNTKVTVQKISFYCQKDFKQVIIKITRLIITKKKYSVNGKKETVNSTSVF